MFAPRLQLGLGASGYVCPSIEQLQGVYDPADPCQGTTAASGSYTTIPTAYGDYQVLSTGQVVDPNGNIINTAASQAISAGIPATSTSGMSQTTMVLIVAAVAAGLFFMGGR